MLCPRGVPLTDTFAEKAGRMTKRAVRNLIIAAIVVAVGLCGLDPLTGSSAQGLELFQGWDNTSKVMYVTGVTLLTVDYFQTRSIVKDPLYEERNPVLDNIGEDGIALYFSGWVIGSYVVADWLPQNYRRTFLGILNSVEIYAVGNNLSVGVRMNF